MRLPIVLLMLAWPLLELALLIRTGQAIGVWPTLGIVVATAVLGVVVLRRQGNRMLSRLQEALAAGRAPADDGTLAAGPMVVLAAMLLILPGLMTDVAGLLLLIPGIRRLVARRIGRTVMEAENVHIEVVTREHRRTGPDRDGRTIEGEFERLDERPAEPGARPPATRPEKP